jgi:hypothetical protein
VYVVLTDIADFYARLYLHRVENTLDVATANKGVKRFIETTIKSVRSRQSHGIPVGCSASRLIAEVALADSDSALVAEGIDFTRYVDDFRIFVRDDQDPYRALAFLAEQLSVTEGLTLNTQKTRIQSSEEFVEYLDRNTEDAVDEAERAAIEALSNFVYFQEPDFDDIEPLRAVNLVGMLDREINEDVWDLGRIRGIFRGLRVTLAADAVAQIVSEFGRYLPFIKEVVLLLHDLKRNGLLQSAGLEEAVVEHVKKGSISSVPTVRAWLYEMAVRGLVTLENRTISQLPNAGALDSR